MVASSTPPVVYSETFIAAYDLTAVNGSYQLSGSSGPGGLFPAALEVTLSTTQGAQLSPSEQVAVTTGVGQLSPADGNYVFVGTATIGNVSTGVILQDAADGSFYYATDGIYSSGSGQASNVDTSTPVTLSSAPPTLSTCFMAGTDIATPEGPVAVEALALGQLVVTADGQAMPVRWIGRQTIVRRFARDNLPIRIKANAIAHQVPCRDLLLSPAHALFIDGVLAQAGALVNGVSILREACAAASFVYYHVELDAHALLLAENTPAESFVDNVERTVFDNWHEYQALYPAGRSITEMPWPRARSYRQVPRALRQRLQARGQALVGDQANSAA